jgi:hypothetical protein
MVVVITFLLVMTSQATWMLRKKWMKRIGKTQSLTFSPFSFPSSCLWLKWVCIHLRVSKLISSPIKLNFNRYYFTNSSSFKTIFPKNSSTNPIKLCHSSNTVQLVTLLKQIFWTIFHFLPIKLS